MLFSREGGWQEVRTDYCSIFLCVSEIERNKWREMGQNWGLAMSDGERLLQNSQVDLESMGLAACILYQFQICFYGYQTGKIQVQGKFWM